MTFIQNFNYTKAMNQASQVDTVANDMLSVANKQMQNTLDSIGACWQGEASRQFIGYCATTQADMRAQASKLQDLAKRIREGARIIRDAEEKATALQSQQAGATGGGRF